MLNRVWVLLLALILLFPFFGHSSQQEPVVEIRVVRGDTLRVLCLTYLNDTAAWPEVARLNRLRNPNLIYPGQVLIIPVRLLKGAPSEGKAGFLRGRAEIRLPGSEEWQPLSSGDRVPQGSFVRTLESSALEIEFENGDTCFLRPMTTLGMTTTAREGSTWIRKLFLQVGKIVTRIQKATGTQTRFVITTPSAQCAARGTVFRATADADDMSRSEVLEGTISIEAQGRTIEIPEFYGTAAKKGESPLTPRELLPGPMPVAIESAYNRLPFFIEFRPVAKAVSYLAELTRDAAGKNAVLESYVPAGQPFRVSGVEDGVYYLQARAIDDLGLEGIPAAPLEVKIRTTPRPPRLQGVSSGAKLRCGPPAVQWAAVVGAAHYLLQLAKDPGFALIGNQADMFQTSWTSSPLAMGDYYLRARSIADDGYAGDWSETYSFSVLPPYAPPALDKPARDRGLVRLRWSDLGQGILYRLQVAKDKEFLTLVDEEIVRMTETSIAEPVESGRYYVRVKAFDGEGCESGFSNIQDFRKGGFLSFILNPCWLVPLGLLIYLLAR